MDLYDVLGVSRTASTAEVRRAYQRLARQFHPALNPGDPAAGDRFRAVSEAHGVLSDAQKRAQYDRAGGVPAAPAPPRGPEVGFEGFDFSAEVAARGSVAFREIFAGVLSRPVAEPVRGEDLEQATRVTFEECFRGATRRIHLVRQAECAHCTGSGVVAAGPAPCAACQGAGQLRASRGRMLFSRRCTACLGSGVRSVQACGRCEGGRVMRSEWLELAIPAGVQDQSELRLPGCGNSGLRGGPPGDFVLVVRVEVHPFYRREGDDLHCQVPVTITEAALGGHVLVPTPDGPVAIEIPAGTQAGQRFRLRKRGLPRVGEKSRGDLYVEARIWVPRVEDDPSRELLREFARRNPCDPRQDLTAQPATARVR